GETVIVGVNKFADGEDPPMIPAPDVSALEQAQVARVRATRAARDGARAHGTLATLGDAARRVANKEAGVHLMPLIIEAVRARATVGEISDTLAAQWGTYRPGS
ncbi:MAG: methylmalonyl-CoA mutase family protein, partial [Gemmatimonadota bacterium]